MGPVLPAPSRIFILFRDKLRENELMPIRRAAKDRPLVVKKRAARRQIQLSVRDCLRRAAALPEILKTIGEESRRNRTDTLSSRQIDRIIKVTRTTKSER
jgi:hypothetical protein